MSTRQNDLLLRIAERRVEGATTDSPEDPGELKGGQLLLSIASRPSGVTFKRDEKRDIGVGGAFVEGVKSGLQNPLAILPGITRREEDVRIDESGEKISNFVGTMAGLGISFVPFAAATGIALRGVGLAARMSPIVYNFTRNVIAGSAQFAGESETLGEVPGKLALGAAFGGAIEGLFLANAMRGRASRLVKSAENTRAPLTNGVESSVVERELALTSQPFESPAKIEVVTRTFDNPTIKARVTPSVPEVEVINPRELAGLELNIQGARLGRELAEIGTLQFETSPPAIKYLETTKSEGTSIYDMTLADLTDIDRPTVRIPGAQNPEALVAYAKERFPGAQVLRRTQRGIAPGRSAFGIEFDEVLIHNPSSVVDQLDATQIKQFESTGFFQGMEVLYNNRSWVATGAKPFQPRTEGRIQLMDLKSGRFVEPKVEDIIKPLSPQVFYTENSIRNRVLQEALKDADARPAFLMPNPANPETLIRGQVNTEGFETVTSVRDFMTRYKNEILDEAGRVGSSEGAVLSFAQKRGIKGLLIKAEGQTVDVKVFDPQAVKISGEIPKLGVSVHPVEIGLNPDGTPVLQGFVPSWKNTLIESLRSRGVAEKDMQAFLDLHVATSNSKLAGLMDAESSTALQIADAQFTGGCI